MCESEEVDLVFTATPWRWHVPVCLAAMENGKHAATEVPAAYTVEDCWRLVEHADHLLAGLEGTEGGDHVDHRAQDVALVRQRILQAAPLAAQVGAVAIRNGIRRKLGQGFHPIHNGDAGWN